MKEGRPSAELARTLFAWDKDQLVELVNDLGDHAKRSGKYPQLQDREGRKRVLARLGVNADTANEFRVVEYFDKQQDIYLLGCLRADGSLQLTHSIVVPDAAGWDDQPRIRALLEEPIKTLPKPIEIPGTSITITKRKDLKGGDEPGASSERLKLSEAEGKRLTTEITLLALAHQVVEAGTTAISGEYLYLPPAGSSREHSR